MQLQLIGFRFEDRFLIEEKIGAGGWGVVYRAYDEKLERPVALKVLNPDLLIDKQNAERFFREARAIGTLQHPSIVRFLSYGVCGNLPYFAMELIEGKSILSIRQKNTVFQIDEVRGIALELSSALALAHSRDILHRDISPNNVLITPDGRAKLIDFGLVKVLSDPSLESQKLTQTGSVLGSPLYMSPEQASGLPASKQSEIYSLACLLYFCLTGKPPFDSDTVPGVLFQHANASTPHVRATRSDCPRWLDELLYKCMAKDPKSRPDSMTKFNELLTLGETHDLDGSKRPLRAILAVVLIAIFIAVFSRGIVQRSNGEQTQSLRQIDFERLVFICERASIDSKRNRKILAAEAAVGRAVTDKQPRLIAEAYDLHSRTMAIAGNLDQALKSWHQADRRWKTLLPPGDQKLVEHKIRLSELQESAAKYNEAIATLETALPSIQSQSLQDKIPELIARLAVLDLKTGQIDSAREQATTLCTQISKSKSPNMSALAIAELVLAGCDNIQSKPAQAEVHALAFHRSIDRKGFASLSPATAQLARQVYEKYGRPPTRAEAASSQERMKQAEQNLLKGEKQIDATKYDDAITILDRAIALSRKANLGPSLCETTALQLRGQCFFNKQDYPQAIREWRQALDALRREGESTSFLAIKVNSSLATAYERMNNPDAAALSYASVMDAKQVHRLSSANDLVNWIRLDLKTNEYCKCVSKCDYLMDRAPKDSESYALALFMKGEAFSQLKEDDKARGAFEKLLQLTNKYKTRHNLDELAQIRLKALAKGTPVDDAFRSAIGQSKF